MNPRSRRVALCGIGVVAVLASVDALTHSYAGLYGWAVHHRLSGWQAWSWPAEIDVFLVVGELALYVAYLDAWPRRQRAWPWVTAVTGLAVSVAGNIGHIQALPGEPVSFADRVTAATSPVAAFAGLMIGLLVLKMSGQRADASETAAWRGRELSGDSSSLVADATEIFLAAHARGSTVSRRALAAELRGRGHAFSNEQLREIADKASRPVAA
jgi:Protein of unknown function (DUF2637)